ncbi:MAG: hypothetical protein RMJ07_04175 [Nitrososphaerota archaeon]|nr:hypothetical protein [Candidatus Bathyarchaeota archaeon]MDW8048861.1 hypothetical protein [Nitrososphaerota archaeon]
MAEKSKLKVHLEIDGVKADFEGDVNEALKLIFGFLSKVFPSLEIAQKISYNPNIAELSEKLVGLVEITDDGPILSRLDLSSRDAICISLLGAYVGNMIGKLPKATLSSAELARIIGKARKTVSNEIPKLLSNGIIERRPDGEYGLTLLGIRRVEEILKVIRESRTPEANP